MVKIDFSWHWRSDEGAHLDLNREVTWPFIPSIGMDVDADPFGPKRITAVLIWLDGKVTVCLEDYHLKTDAELAKGAKVARESGWGKDPL